MSVKDPEYISGQETNISVEDPEYISGQHLRYISGQETDISVKDLGYKSRQETDIDPKYISGQHPGYIRQRPQIYIQPGHEYVRQCPLRTSDIYPVRRQIYIRPRSPGIRLWANTERRTKRGITHSVNIIMTVMKHWLEYIPTVRLSVPTADVYIVKKLATVEDFALLHEDKIYSESKTLIEFSDSYKAPPNETTKDKGPAGEVSSSTKKKRITVAITAKDMQKRKNDVKARTTLLLALPDEHRLRFSKYDSAKELWEAILKTFGGNEATKKTKKNQLKQQYGNFKAEGSKILEQNFNRLQLLGSKESRVKLTKYGLHFFIKHQQWKSKVLTIQGDSTASAQVSTVSIDVKKTGKKITIQGSDVAGFDKSKVECFNCHKMGHFARECRSPRSQDRWKKESYKKDFKVEEPAPKAMVAIDEEVPIEYALMAKSSSSSDNEKDLYWMGLPEFVDDTITDYTRPTPSIDVSKSVSKEQEERWKSNHPYFFEQGGSSGNVVPKPMIKFVKESGCPNATKVNNTENTRKLNMKYAEIPNIPTVGSKVPTAKPAIAADKGNKGKAGIPQDNIDDKGYWDSGCSRHMTSNISYLSEYEPFNGGYVSFVHGRGKITGKGSIKTDESMLWHKRLGHLNFKTMNKLVRSNLVKGLPSKIFKNDHSCVACLKGKQHKAFSRTMLADAKLPVTFWPEAVNTACYVQNRVLVTKPHNKTPYELFNERSPAIGFLRPFGCHVMILNTLDHLGKFDAKGDESYFVGYSLSSKAFRVFNKRTKKIEENLHVDLSENKSIKKRTGPDWLFDIVTLTNSMNYVPVVVAGTSSTNISGTKEDVHQAVKKKESPLRFIALPNWFHEAQITTLNEAAKKDDAILDNNSLQKEQQEVNGDKEVFDNSRNSNPTASSKVSANDSFELASGSTVETEDPTVSSPVPTDSLSVPLVTSSVPKIISRGGSSFQEPLTLGNAMSVDNRLEDFFGDTSNTVSLNEVEANLSNMETAIQVSSTPTLRIHKDHPKSQIIGLVDTPVQTRHKTKDVDEQSFIAIIHQKTNPDLLQFCLFSCFLSQEEPKKIVDDLKDLNVKSTFLYGTIDEEVYVMQPPGFQDPEFPHRVYKVKRLCMDFIKLPELGMTIVATSEAEYVAAASGCGQVLWIQNQLLDYGRSTRGTIRISQVKVPSPGADETAFPSGDVRYGEAFPTDTSLDAGQDRENIDKTSAMPHEALLRVTSLGGGEGKKKVQNQDLKITQLKTRIKTLEDNERIREGLAQEDTLNTGGMDQWDDLLVGDTVKDSDKSADKGSDSIDEMSHVLGSLGAANILASGGLRLVFTTASIDISPVIATASESFPTAVIFTIASVATPTTRVTRSSRGVVIGSSSLISINISSISKKDKGKGKMTEPEQPSKYEVLEQISIQLARELEAKFAQEDLIIREQAERDSVIARIHAERELEEQQCEDPKELSEEELKKMMELVPVEELYIEALLVKYPITDWEIYSEGQRKCWKIIRVGNHTEVYQLFEDILKKFDREDLDKLWSLVKETCSTTEVIDEKVKELWVEIKRLYEPDSRDPLWALQRYMHDPLVWRLYDTCGVHHVSIGKGHQIFMLVEKD
nr:ribonuclease H-like domain-containing protein [Tanacetum cinerariifolium]